MSKILTIDELKSTVIKLQHSGKKVVFTNGCFDIMHAGHADYMEKARALGDTLVVGVNSDHSIRCIKGDKRPIVNQEYRTKLLSAMESINYITIFDDPTPENLIRNIKPDILVKGSDWEGKKIAGEDFVNSYGGQVKFIKLLPNISTTDIIKKVLEVYGQNSNC